MVVRLSSNVMTKGKTSKLNLIFDKNLLREGSNNNQETNNSDNSNSDGNYKSFSYQEFRFIRRIRPSHITTKC